MEQLLDRFAGEYDYIIIDLPPVNVVSDALTVSPNLSGMLVVVRSNYSKRREVNKCLRSLGLARVRVLGIVMTAKPLSGLSYSKKGRYKSNYHYRYGYGYGKAPELQEGDKAVNTEEAQND
jgi:Mrp family chromosome partitioning ATPase